MTDVYLGIGSNMGDKENNIARAMQFLKEHEEIEVVAQSSLMESEPEGEGDGEKYLNGALHVRTELSPLELLSQLKMIERRLGRQKGPVNSPRPMDLDILFYDDVVIVEGKTLSIPHPRLEKRLFVLKPLLELAPDFVHPRLKKTVRELWEHLSHESYSTEPRA